jgi:16S rRNA (adenine(1408)-N(1))-methyltransferase
MGRHERLVVELGSGDGSAVMAAARADATTLCVGIDTDAAAPREASSRAARPAHRGGLPNALFLAADGRTLPEAFRGRIDEVRIILPWGSLLRAVLAADPDLVSAVASGLRPGGRARVLVSLTPRDMPALGALAVDQPLVVLARSLEGAGLEVAGPRAVTADDLASLRSSWARRLGIPTRRPATLLEAVARAS